MRIERRKPSRLCIAAAIGSFIFNSFVGTCAFLVWWGVI